MKLHSYNVDSTQIFHRKLKVSSSSLLSYTYSLNHWMKHLIFKFENIPDACKTLLYTNKCASQGIASGIKIAEHPSRITSRWSRQRWNSRSKFRQSKSIFISRAKKFDLMTSCSILQINPQHTVPTLADDNLVLWDRLIISVRLSVTWNVQSFNDFSPTVMP